MIKDHVEEKTKKKAKHHDKTINNNNTQKLRSYSFISLVAFMRTRGRRRTRTDCTVGCFLLLLPFFLVLLFSFISSGGSPFCSLLHLLLLPAQFVTSNYLVRTHIKNCFSLSLTHTPHATPRLLSLSLSFASALSSSSSSSRNRSGSSSK